jgi:hypothetical protein
MIVRKTLLAASALALMSTPAWALPSQAPSNHGTKDAPSTTPVGPPSTTPNNTDNPGAANRSQNGNDSGNKGAGHKGNHGSNQGKGKGSHPGQSHKCMPHKVGYVASGTLESWTLNENTDGTYSGEVEVKVTHTNHHAKGDNEKTTKYPVTKVHVTFGGIADTNKDGKITPADLAKGDRVKVIGKITSLSKKCSQTGFTATTTIRKIVFHPPATP